MLSLQLSPLQLEGYYVRELQFAVRPGLEEQTRFAMQNGLHIQTEGLFNPEDITFNFLGGGALNQEDPSRLMSIIEIRTDNPPERRVPYDFRVVLVGYFKLNVNEPTEYMKKVEAQIRANAISILYSAARELVAAVTSRGPFPGMVLPSAVITINPVESATEGQSTQPSKRAAKKTLKRGRSKKKSG